MTAHRAIELSLLPSCPVRCPYCPTDVLKWASDASGQSRRQMTPRTAELCVSNASEAPEGHVLIDVHLAGFTESLLASSFNDIFAMLESHEAVRRIIVKMPRFFTVIRCTIESRQDHS